ncbi:MAG: lytic murein transglycosylase, partial [Polaromonas sp.]|nr:lytic murein transglycosylase [Polaromonas sp.]
MTIQAPLHHFKIAIFLIAAIAGTAGVSEAKTFKRAVSSNAAQSEDPLYATRPEAMQFADDLASRRNLDPDWVRGAIGQSRYLPTVSRLMQPPAQAFVKNWRVYRRRFIDPIRIAAGVRFWQDNQAALARAQEEYGVPAEIIVGVIGVETIYGRNTGSFRVMDALSTLAFDFPADHPRATERSEYFKSEIEQFLTLESRRGATPLEALEVKGSYAGAMGMPQFMPSS